MNTRIRRISLFAALTAGTTLAAADTTLEMTAAPGAARHRIQVSEGRLRMTTGTPAQPVVVLYREGMDQYQVLDPASKSVMTFTPQQAQQTLQQASGMMQQMQAMLAEQMKNLPPDQRARMEQMMGKPAAAAERTKPQLRKSGRSERVGPWSCAVVEVVEGARATGELCLAKADALGIPERDYRTLKAFYTLMGSMADAARQGMGQDLPYFAPEAMTGVPVRAMHYRGGAKKEVTMRLDRVGSEPLEGRLFDVPGDYQPARLPTMPGMPAMPTR